MADRTSFPQIPSTVWWGVRGLLQRSPNITINERTLGVELQVQEAASRQYVTELKRVGILNEENKATELAGHWRHDESYADSVQRILLNTYPEELVQLAPPGSADRQKVVSWFTRQGLGTGTAGNKAATYLLIGSESPNETPVRGVSGSQKTQSREAQPAKRTSAVRTESAAPPNKRAQEQKSPQSDPIPLNLNVQIHISAEASGEQIETIFSAMRRYLYDGPAA